MRREQENHNVGGDPTYYRKGLTRFRHSSMRHEPQIKPSNAPALLPTSGRMLKYYKIYHSSNTTFFV
jgi:hypothetical protein